MSMSMAIEQLQELAAKRVWAGLIETARHDVNTFIEVSFKNDQDPAAPPFKQQDFHREWQAIWKREKFSVIHGATGFGKTDQRVGAHVFDIGSMPKIRIGLWGKKQDSAIERLRKIKRQIEENAVIRHIFPKLRPGPVWNDERLRVADAGVDTTTDTLVTFGIEGSPVGKRLDVADLDDVVDDENTRNEEQRKRVLHRIDTAIVTRLTTEGRLSLTANAWDLEDAAHVFAGRPGVFHGVYPAIYPDGRLLWGDFRTRAWLNAMRDTMTPSKFAQMFLCQATSDETRIFKDEWFQRARAFGLDKKPAFEVRHAFDHDWTLLDVRDVIDATRLAQQELRVFIGVDLATGDTEKKRKTDFTVFFVLGIDSRGMRHVLWIEKGRWDAGESVRRLASLAKRYRPVSVLVETNGTQKFFLSYAREFNSELRIEPFVTTGEKWDASTGIEAIGIEMQAGKWVIPNPTAAIALSGPEREALDNINEWASHLRGFSRVGHTPDDVMAGWFAQKGAMRDGAPVFQMQLPSAIDPVAQLPAEWDPLRGWNLSNKSTVEALLDAPRVEIADDLPQIPDHIRKSFGLP